jgi:nucleoside-triphosphatase
VQSRRIPTGLSSNSPGALPASFIFPKDFQPGLTLVTGPRGIGKTRWCIALADHTRALGLDVRGLVSPAVMKAGQKIGIDLLDLASGERRRLAYRKGEADGDIATTDWQMVSETLHWGSAILEGIHSCDLFILDELGPLEFEQGVGLVAGLNFVDTHRDLPCFVVIRPSLLSIALQRWPWAITLDLAAEASS